MDQGGEKTESTPSPADRRAREAAALRSNLQRRKQQARDRETVPPAAPPAPHPPQADHP